jgi:orotidine-5'-phosphate decarboxylase
MTFTQKLQRSVSSANSLLCVGLDPDPARIPSILRQQYRDEPTLVLEFCRRIIETTKTLACAYKPNSAFFEALGSDGWKVYKDVIDQIPSNRIVIADAKRGDIGNTALKYKTAFFDQLHVDALTLNPLMGMDTIDPYMDDDTKALFVLTMTSNKGSADFLQRRFEGRMSLGEYIAEELSKKQGQSQTHLGMVIGATQIEAIKPVLNSHPDAHLLIPGIGTQGGSSEQLKTVLQSHKGIPVISSSRSIIYAGNNDEDWLESVYIKALEMKDSLQEITERYV